MSDGISDSNRERSLDDILGTGAAWITETELQDLGRQLKQYRANWFRLRDAAIKAQDALERGETEGIAEALNRALWP